MYVDPQGWDRKGRHGMDQEYPLRVEQRAKALAVAQAVVVVLPGSS